MSIASQAGFTLIEMLVSAILSIVVLTAVLSALEASQNAQSRDQEWALVIQEARTGLATMTHEIRQAYKIKPEETTHTKITFYATIASKSWEIQYNCAEPQAGTEYHECVRRAAQFAVQGEPGKEEEVPPTSLPATGVPVIKDVINGTEKPILQELLPNAITPDLVTIQLLVPAAGTLKLAGASAHRHNVTLSDAAYIRDMALGG